MRCDGWHRDLDLSPVARAHIAPERFDAARRHATPDADRRDAATDEAIAACGGDVRRAQSHDRRQ